MQYIGWLMVLTGLVIGLIHCVCCYRMESRGLPKEVYSSHERGYSLDWLICLFKGHDWNIDDPNTDVCQKCGRVEKAISIYDL